MTKEELKKKQIESGYKHINNLIKWNEMPPDELKAIKQKGQKATMEKRKSKKNIKGICNELLNMNASDIASGVVSPELAKKLENTDITLYDLIVAKQIENALTTGSVKSAEFLRDSNGDKPTDKIQSDINVINESDSQLLQLINDRLNMIEDIQTGKIIDS